jgi:chemotaxis protein MotA
MALEADSDFPDQRPVFSKYPKFLKDHHAQVFVCDTIRMAAAGGIEPFDVDQMMELDMEVHHQEQSVPVSAFHHGGFPARPGDRRGGSRRGHNHGRAGGPPEEIGRKVAAALMGTFLGILFCYGFVGPVASNLAKSTDEEHAYYHVLRVVIVSFIKGAPPTIAVEFGRRAVPGNVRPSFQEMKKYLKSGFQRHHERLAHPRNPAVRQAAKPHRYDGNERGLAHGAHRIGPRDVFR